MLRHEAGTNLGLFREVRTLLKRWEAVVEEVTCRKICKSTPVIPALL